MSYRIHEEIPARGGPPPHPLGADQLPHVTDSGSRPIGGGVGDHLRFLCPPGRHLLRALLQQTAQEQALEVVAVPCVRKAADFLREELSAAFGSHLRQTTQDTPEKLRRIQ